MVSVTLVQCALKGGTAGVKKEYLHTPNPTPPGCPLLPLQDVFVQPCSKSDEGIVLAENR